MTTLNIGNLDYFYDAVFSLIVDDLKLHKHFHYLNQAGLDKERIKLKIHESIFQLIGFKEITEPLSELYFREADNVLMLEFREDESDSGFKHIAGVIMEKLMERRNLISI